MDQAEFHRCCALLGVGPEVTLEKVERAFLAKNFALIRSGATEDRTELRAAYTALVAHCAGKPTASVPPRFPPPASVAPLVRPPVPVAADRSELFSLTSFDSWLVNALALPVVALLAWAINASPFGFFLRGFHVWMHEFGHATVAWLTGKRALPLPIGWTNVEPEKSPAVYFGILFLLAVLAVAGWRERKIWPVLIAVFLAPLQYYMTWRLSEARADEWLAFAGVGGEFYLSTALMALFYVQFPEKFRWGGCRYVFLFLGASSFLNIFLFWQQVKRGTESIPWGSMVQGEEDGGGDMNILRDSYAWSNHDLVGTYTQLGHACLLVLAVVYLAFALRLDRLTGRAVVALFPD